MITLRAAATLAGVTRQAIMDRIRRGSIRAAKDMISGLWMVDETDLDRKPGGRPRTATPKPKRRPGRPRKTP